MAPSTNPAYPTELASAGIRSKARPSYLRARMRPLLLHSESPLAKYLTGMQNESWMTMAVLFLVAITLGATLHTLWRFLKQHGEKSLTTRHAVKLLGFWVILEVILMPNIHHDFFYHHRWKIITHINSLSEWYDARPYQLDYPPLFAYL